MTWDIGAFEYFPFPSQPRTTYMPYELHEFQLGETSTYWRYADAPVDIVYDGNIFTAAWMTGGKIEHGVNMSKEATTVKCGWKNAFVWQYTIASPNDTIHYKRYRGDISYVQLIYLGEVDGVVFKQESRKGKRYAEISISKPKAFSGQIGLISRYSRQCTVELYSEQCGVDRESFKETGTLDDVDGNTLTSTVFGGQSDGYWKGGDIIVNNRRVKIIDHTGNDITVLPYIYGAQSGDSFDAAPGCDHLIATCNGIFNNRANMKAQPNTPYKNPFGNEELLE